MTRKFVDLSIYLENDVLSDPPAFAPKIQYLRHDATVEQIAAFFPGLMIQMAEAMTSPAETPGVVFKPKDWLNASKTKGQSKANGKDTACRFSARHRKGGQLLFADGHISWLSREDATTDIRGGETCNIPGKLYWVPENK